ncbi:MAG: four-carbon acid sugar kinase family protein [Alsobacter sp.]
MAAPLLTFYGDDFTGSSAVMEVLGFAGLPTMMFLAPPGPDVLARFPGLRAIGIAGVSRSRDPAWMEANLPPAFRALAAFGAPVSHYKVCSTFDSSPSIGSIGKAIDLGAPILGGAWHPLVVGAPAIRRYQAFGHLFAGAPDGVFRLDRHPVMSRHPVTPMDEADLRLHLGRQTARGIGLVDLAALKAGQGDAALAAERRSGAEVVALDVIDEETLAEAGRLVWNEGRGPVFAIGSQGVEYALVAHWRRIGLVEAEPQPPVLQAVERLFAVSGSCSPTTAAQIRQAEAQGWAVRALDASLAADPRAFARACEAAAQEALHLLPQGRDVIVATALGPDDPAIGKVAAAAAAAGLTAAAMNDAIGAGLGRIVETVRRRSGLRRVAIAGGDTSGHALTALGAEALSPVAPLAPGAPLCRLHAGDPAIDGLEVTLKGGQMGQPDFFLRARSGTD